MLCSAPVGAMRDESRQAGGEAAPVAMATKSINSGSGARAGPGGPHPASLLVLFPSHLSSPLAVKYGYVMHHMILYWMLCSRGIVVRNNWKSYRGIYKMFSTV